MTIGKNKIKQEEIKDKKKEDVLTLGAFLQDSGQSVHQQLVSRPAV